MKLLYILPLLFLMGCGEKDINSYEYREEKVGNASLAFRYTCSNCSKHHLNYDDLTKDDKLFYKCNECEYLTSTEEHFRRTHCFVCQMTMYNFHLLTYENKLICRECFYLKEKIKRLEKMKEEK